MTDSKELSEGKKREIDSIKKELILINAKLSVFYAMFSDEKRRDLLIEAAPLLFGLLQKIIIDDLIISFGRITESAKTRKNKNCTIERLVSDSEAGKKLNEEISLKLKKIRKIRDKQLAHRDLEVVTSDDYLGYDVTGKEMNVRIELTDSLSELGDIVKKINGVVNSLAGENTIYHYIQTKDGPDLGVKKLIDRLKAGSFYHYLEESKKIDPNNFYDEWSLFRHKDA